MRTPKSLAVAALLALAACSDDPVNPNPGDMWLGFHDATAYHFGGANPTALAVFDVNGDNRPDVITLDPAINGARIALGNAAGDYTVLGSITLGAGAFDLRITDVNDDHIGDIVAAGGNNLLVSLGSPQGPGAATSHPLFPGATAVALTVGDFDNDLDPDVSVITTRQSNVGWSWWGRAADGSLENRVDYLSVTAAAGVQACTVDIAGDGYNDVVIATTSAAAPLVVFPNTGGVTFEQQQVVGQGTLTASATARLACADFDLDGAVDVMVLEPGANARLTYYRGSSTGLVLHETGLIGNASDIAAIDADGDANADVVIARPADEAIDLMLGDGEGEFGDPAAILVGGAPKYLAIQDVNRDGHMDIVMTRNGSIAVLRNAGR